MDSIDATFNERFAKWTITDKSNSLLKGTAYDQLTSTEQVRSEAIKKEQVRSEAIKKWSAKNNARTDGRKNKPISGWILMEFSTG